MRSFFYRGRFIFIPFAIAALVALAGFIVMSLWNALMPVIFHLGVITFWQAVGLFVLCKVLFGFGHGGHRGGPWRNKRFNMKDMTPEERQRFKEKWARCGGRHGWDMDDKSEVLSPEPKVE
jgi:hypothetical protein